MPRVFLAYIFYEIKKKLSGKALLLTEVTIALLLIAAVYPLSSLIRQETSRVSRFCVAIVDEDKSLYTQLFMGQILASPSIQDNLDVVLTDRKEAMLLLEKNEIAGMIIIPAIFTENMQTGAFSPLELYLNNNMPLQARLIEEGMKSGAYLMSTVQNALFAVYAYSSLMPVTQAELDSLFNSEMLVLISEALDRNDLYSREGKTPWADLEMTDYYMLSLPVVLMSFFGCGIIFGFWEDERNNVNNRILLMRGTYFQITCGNAIASSLVLLLQGTFIFLPLLLTGKNIYQLIPMVVLISLQISLLNMILGYLAKKPAEGALASVVLNLVMALMSGTLIPVYFFPSFIPEGVKFFTLHFWWQRSLVSIYTSGAPEGQEYIAAFIIIWAMLGILRGVIYAKHDTRYIYSTKRA